MSSFTELTIDRLCVSPLNVRQSAEDCDDTAWLEESIAATGLIYPLVVHPLEDGTYGALDGGRRFRAITKLIKAKRLAADWPVICVVREDLSDAEMTELSLTAAIQPRELHPWEIDAAIVRAHLQGDSVADIVERIGQPERWVRQRLALGRLAPEIFDAYASGDLAIEEARAYAGTEDQELQRAAWQHFQELSRYQRSEGAIRAWLKIGDREEQKLLQFVGEAIYRAAGGRFELDLFAEGPDRGRVTDPAKLRELAENKMSTIRQDLRRRTQQSDLRFADPPQRGGYYGSDHDLEIKPRTRTANGEERIILPKGEVIAHIAIQPDGTHEVSWWWASRKAKRAAEKPGKEEPDPPVAFGKELTGAEAMGEYRESEYAKVARASVKDEFGFTADGLQVARSIRRTLLRALLVSDASEGGTLGRDFLAWSLLRQELGDDRWSKLGARGLAREWGYGAEDAEPGDKVSVYLAEMPAHTLWLQAVARVSQEPFMTIEDPADAFEAYHRALEPVKMIAEAVLAGLALARSLKAPGWDLATHDLLAAMAGGNDAALREGWEPTEDFIGLLPKLKRLELARPYVGQAQTAEWSKLKDAEITRAVTQVLRDQPDWMHPLLSFSRNEAGTLAHQFEKAATREAAA